MIVVCSADTARTSGTSRRNDRLSIIYRRKKNALPYYSPAPWSPPARIAITPIDPLSAESHLWNFRHRSKHASSLFAFARCTDTRYVQYVFLRMRSTLISIASTRFRTDNQGVTPCVTRTEGTCESTNATFYATHRTPLTIVDNRRVIYSDDPD